MGKRNNAFNKESEKRISFEELVQLIGQKCDYKFAKGISMLSRLVAQIILKTDMVKEAMIGCRYRLKIIC